MEVLAFWRGIRPFQGEAGAGPGVGGLGRGVFLEGYCSFNKNQMTGKTGDERPGWRALFPWFILFPSLVEGW